MAKKSSVNFSSPTLADGKSSGWRVGKISVDRDLVLLIWALEGQFTKSNKLQEIRSISNEENFKWGVYEDAQCSAALKAEPKMLHWKDKARWGKCRNANTGQHDIAEYKWYWSWLFIYCNAQSNYFKKTNKKQTNMLRQALVCTQRPKWQWTPKNFKSNLRLIQQNKKTAFPAEVCVIVF